eukprot:TRINITY_DN3427_c0_g1_i25.p1 TRINITY_DN3427_c0_g1~~TRINITY_DN3427_c0_g1_i25.p1  ORF type:complete len:237 (+),score=37.24 TRINITY_DN3427_c0_g1_i25:216-926(+)
MEASLSASFYQAAAALNRFHKHCAAQTNRQMLTGIRSLCEMTAVHVKRSAQHHQVQVGSVVCFLQQQIIALTQKEEQAVRELSGTQPWVDSQHSDDSLQLLFERSCASLAQMYTHVDQSSLIRSLTAAREAAHDLIGLLIQSDSQQTITQHAMLELLQRCYEQHQQRFNVEQHCETLSNSSVSEQEEAGYQHSGPQANKQRTRKRYSCSADETVLDPAFEQAFKRQCQSPPTPPSL